MYLKLLVGITVALFQVELHSDPAPEILGQYVGTLKHEKLQKEQLAKLDFFPYREGTNLRFFSVLTLHFGDFESTEYVSYHFDTVRFLLLPPVYTFDQPNQDISIQNGKFLEDGSFQGRVVSKIAGATVGVLDMRRGGTATPSLPLIEPIWGEYRGVCNPSISGDPREMLTNLQLLTHRSNGVTTDEGNPFSAYEIKGQIGEPSDDVSGGERVLWKLSSSILSGSYNFFDGTVTLIGNSGDLECQATIDGLVCNQCRLKRVSLETKAPRTLKPPRPKSIFSPEIDLSEIINPGSGGFSNAQGRALELGDYVGYLHHELLNQYQPARLHIEEFQDPTLGATRLSVSSNIFFGGLNSHESLTYAFQHHPATLMPFYVFKNPETDVDMILLLTPSDAGVVRGVWFSLLFGRVGTFELRKNEALPLPEGARMIGNLSAKFKGPEGELNVIVKRATSPVMTLNPFRQLKIEGSLGPHPGGAVPMLRFKDGSYDFYTGKMAIEVSEKTSVISGWTYPERFLAGWRVTSDKLLFKMTIRGTPLFSRFSEHSLETYTRIRP